MKRLSKIDDGFKIYRGKKVILFGASSAGKRICHELKLKGIEIYKYCDNCKEKWKTNIDGKEIISPKQLLDDYTEDTLVQVASEYDNEIIEQLKDMNILNFVSYAEYVTRTENLKFYQLKQKSSNLYKKYIYSDTSYEGLMNMDNIWKYFANTIYSSDAPVCILSLPPKTGDWTLNDSLKNCGVDYINFWHTFRHMLPELQEVLKDRKIKVITAVREPVSQNISEFFQISEYYWDNEKYWLNGGDYQELFEDFITMELFSDFENMEKTNYIQMRKYKLKRSLAIQKFFEQQVNPYIGMNIYDFPFDTDKGYSIIKKDNVEVFIYQLEKLNKIKDELGKFIGVSNLQLINNNEGKNKWYASVYEDAKKNLVFSKEYFDYCYNCNYTKHFYSESDIKKFKEKWQKHII